MIVDEAEYRYGGHAFAVIANIIKHAIYVRPGQVWRAVLGFTVWPVVQALLRFDVQMARRFATLATFSTGYLTLAERI